MGREGRKTVRKHKGRRETGDSHVATSSLACGHSWLSVVSICVASLEWLTSCIYTEEYSRYTNTGACVTFSGPSVAADSADKVGVFSPEGMGQDQAHVYNEKQQSANHSVQLHCML